MGEESQHTQPGNREPGVLVLLCCCGAWKSITAFPKLQFLQLQLKLLAAQSWECLVLRLAGF